MLWIFAAASESNFARPGLGTYGVPAILAAYFFGALISRFWVSRQIGFWVAVLPAVLVVIMVFLMAIFKGFKSGLNK
jgi:hypothetical protein